MVALMRCSNDNANTGRVSNWCTDGALKDSLIVTALDLFTGTTTALADLHTIDALACQGAAKAIARWGAYRSSFIGPTGSSYRILG